MRQHQAKRLLDAANNGLHVIAACSEVVAGMAMHHKTTIAVELDGQRPITR